MRLPRTPSLRLDGRRACVTGAGRGIGLALAACLAEAGAEVTLVARSAGEIETAAEAIRAEGGRANAAVLDVSDLAAVAEFFGSRPAFQVLVNNAGTNRPKPMMEVSEGDFDAVLDLNLKSAFFVTQDCVQRMLAEEVTGWKAGDTVIVTGSKSTSHGSFRRRANDRSSHCAMGLSTHRHS